MFKSPDITPQSLEEGLKRFEELASGKKIIRPIREFLGLSSGDNLPTLVEMPKAIQIPEIVIEKIVEMTRKSFQDNKEVSVFGYLKIKDDKLKSLCFEKTIWGNAESVGRTHKQLFSIKSKAAIPFVSIHTHVKPDSSIPSASDLSNFTREFRSFPIAIISDRTGLIFLIKSWDFFERRILSEQEASQLAEKYGDSLSEYESQNPQRFYFGYLRHVSTFCAQQGIAFYSSNPNFGQSSQFERAPAILKAPIKAFLIEPFESVPVLK